MFTICLFSPDNISHEDTYSHISHPSIRHICRHIESSKDTFEDVFAELLPEGWISSAPEPVSQPAGSSVPADQPSLTNLALTN